MHNLLQVRLHTNHLITSLYVYSPSLFIPLGFGQEGGQALVYRLIPYGPQDMNQDIQFIPLVS